MYDVIIIGKGPAGLQAATYTARAGLSTLVLGNDDGSLAKAEHIENYFGFSEAVSGRYLLSEGSVQAAHFGAELRAETVLGIDWSETDINCYEVTTSGSKYTGKTVLLTAGKRLPKLAIPGLAELEGQGVSYCATCDGFLYRGKKLGVLGAGEYALHEAEALQSFSNVITVYTNAAPVDLAMRESLQHLNIALNEAPILSCSGQEVDGTHILHYIHFQDGSRAELDGLFVALDRPSSSNFALKLGLITLEDDLIATDTDMSTNLPGIFAAGDCCSTFKQIAVAVGQAAIAAKSIIAYCKETR